LVYAVKIEKATEESVAFQLFIQPRHPEFIS
jgi:hypothetical protein